MTYRTSKEQIDEYYQYQGINQSALKEIIAQGIQQFVYRQQEVLGTNEQYLEDPEHFIIGSGVDSIITEGLDVFHLRYHYSDLPKKPGEKPMIMIKQLYEKLVINKEPYNINENYKATKMPLADIATDSSSKVPAELRPLRFFRKELYDLMDTVVDSKGSVGFYLNQKVPSEKLIKGEKDTRTWMDDNRANAYLFKDDICERYWQDLIKAKGKQILTDEQYNTITEVSNSILNHPYTSYLFNKEDYENSQDLDIIYQCILYWEEEISVTIDGDIHMVTVLCKAMIDTLIINHLTHQLVPLDIKTTRYPISKFNKQVRARRYDVQAAWYGRAIFKSRHTITTLIGKDVSNYEVKDLAFIAESTTVIGTPLIFVLNPELVLVGINGDEEEGLKGARQALQEYCTYKAHNNSVEKVTAPTNGLVFINKNFETDLAI